MKFGQIGAVLVLLMSFLAVEARAQTPVRDAAARLSDALAGEAGARQSLVRDHFTLRLRDDPGETAWLATLSAVASASGGFDIVAAEAAETERFAEYTVRARANGRYARLVLGVARAEPERISTLFLLPARDPAATAAYAWPQTRIDPRALSGEIRRRVDALAAEDMFSGTVLVARNGRIVHEQYAGLANRDIAAVNDRRTIFNLASMGKMFTVIAVGQLAEEGRLSLDDSVERWIPDYPEPLGRRITIAQLLAHTSGLDDVLGPEYHASRFSYLTAASYLPLIARPPLFEPGSRFYYSNAGYALLGVIIERASGESYFDYVERHIFQPARMRNAGFSRLDQPDTHRAVGYFRTADDAFGLGERRSNENVIALQGNAAGGVYATARDVLAFARALRGNHLVSAATVSMLETPRNDMIGAPTPTRYGYGFAVHECSGRTFVGHNGGGAQSGVHSTLLMSADGEWSIVVLSNYDAGPEDIAMSLCRFLALQ